MTSPAAAPLRVLELFAGIGGAAAAVGSAATVVGAVDHDLRAVQVYRRNHTSPVHVKNLVSVKDPWLAAFEADLWWMSPPCAPHGIRGGQADVDDPRSASFLRLLDGIATVRPRWIALENVPWFQDSRAHDRLLRTLREAGYPWTEGTLCPTELGVPAVRKRWYLVAGRDGVQPWPTPTPRPRPLSDFLGPWREELAVSDALMGRFGDALHVVDADDPDAVSACFTRAYGRSPVYVGSYLRQGHDGVSGLRHFAPEEIAALYGFPPGFSFDGLPPAHAWKLIGNSVSVDAVRHVLSAAGLG